MEEERDLEEVPRTYVCVNLSSYRACSPFYMTKGSMFTERDPDRWARQCIINYTSAFNASDSEILSSASVRSF